VHIWSVPHTSTSGAVFDETRLSPDELKRAARLVSTSKRLQFKEARAAVRTILGNYSNIHPTALDFGYTPSGKPYVASLPELAFNVSHTSGLSMLVVGREMQIGVDIEAASDGIDFQRIADLHFAPTESAAIAMLPKARQATAFLIAWTRKEALAKAAGDGIYETLGRQLSTETLPPGHHISYAPEGSTVTRDWFLYSPKLRPPYVASIVLSRPAKRFAEYRHYSPMRQAG
jgi:4'-phosphopantetheinyl transferase